MKLLSVLATSTLLTLGATTSTLAFSATPTQNTKTQTAQTKVVQSTISIDQAINIAKRNAQGVVKSVEFDSDDNQYEVELVSGTTNYKVELDASTGKIVKSKQKKLSTSDTQKYAPLTNAKVSLTQALKNANNTVKGQVTEAEFDTENGQPVYEVKIVKAGEKHKVYVDVNTGKVIKTKLD